jgi:hypothetical protein
MTRAPVNAETRPPPYAPSLDGNAHRKRDRLRPADVSLALFAGVRPLRPPVLPKRHGEPKKRIEVVREEDGTRKRFGLRYGVKVGGGAFAQTPRTTLQGGRTRPYEERSRSSTTTCAPRRPLRRSVCS